MIRVRIQIKNKKNIEIKESKTCVLYKIMDFERNREQSAQNKGFMCKININLNLQQKASDSYKQTTEVTTSQKHFTILSKINEGLQNI